ncbi:hypothetical protein CWB96_21910 [Pseudoalteromonas citrea]|uniref:Uncharacterized protein n=1 Tax=Pseudoalteromonas citrea TaxID=43655 RepID=A0A5S3XGI2_9GAMM|nr:MULTISPECIES: hypothetical protein [Pseudoalteromonas]RJE73551.1 hypothetical protein BGP78_18190 [Pseudoalteromonas sp. MSK9-3]TMP43233.1 hypothetical protein CWB97_09745 [Pseudoalteromonas citrea]TMP52329.1 hypothetical protein CWB96_21910 [Pseudoalteromonas citrea]
MKTLALSLLAVLSTASVAAQSDIITLNSAVDTVSFDKAEVELFDKDGVFSASSTTYYGPKVWVNGRLQSFFVGSTNGNQFCEERGHNQEISGSTIKCGEDESSYANYDWYGKSWTYKSTGSKNQCYQLYATIKCQ